MFFRILLVYTIGFLFGKYEIQITHWFYVRFQRIKQRIIENKVQEKEWERRF